MPGSTILPALPKTDTYHELLAELRERELAVLSQEHRIVEFLGQTLARANFTVVRAPAPKLSPQPQMEQTEPEPGQLDRYSRNSETQKRGKQNG